MMGRRLGSMALSQIVTSYVMLIIAATIDATSVNIFFAPFKIAPGGVTAWQGKGMFTEQNHTVLFITISRAQVISLQRLVHLADPDAFIVIGQGHVAYGEGFKRIKG